MGDTTIQNRITIKRALVLATEARCATDHHIAHPSHGMLCVVR